MRFHNFPIALLVRTITRLVDFADVAHHENEFLICLADTLEHSLALIAFEILNLVHFIFEAILELVKFIIDLRLRLGDFDLDLLESEFG